MGWNRFWVLKNIEMSKNGKDREFLYTNRDFEFLSQLATSNAGIKMPISKKELIYGRLSKRLRKLGLKSFKEYCQLLEYDENGEFSRFINSITTNVTHFFREEHHFRYLEEKVLPEIITRKQASGNNRLRIWSAGCSSGEEAYSIAMVVREYITDFIRWNVRILATDLDSEILTLARQGIYPDQKLENISPERKIRWLEKIRNNDKTMIEINNHLKSFITFKQLNLIGDWPMKGPFDVIFCRNVTIYFDRDTRTFLLNRFADILADGGYLFVGHSESLHGITTRFKPVGQTIHKKIA